MTAVCRKKGDPDFDGYDPYPCDEDTNKKGDLMFKLVKSVSKNKKIKILTYPEKFSDVEAYGPIFFERVNKF